MPQWPIVDDVSLDDVALDSKNVRLGIDGLDEAGIASYLAEAEELLDLVRELLRDGYIDNEIPIVVEENGKYVVLEANRRIAALKAIHDPALVGRFSTQVERHLSRYSDADTPRNIRVMVAPSREAAQPVLARLHTGKPKRSWVREQQAVFYHAQLSKTVSVDDLRTRYPRETGKIVSFIRMGEMRQLIRGLRYDDPELEEFVTSGRLAMSSLEYAYDRPRIRSVLGIDFDDQGKLASRKLTDGQRRGVMHLLARFKAGTLNTRSNELKQSSPQHDSFVEELERVVSGTTAGGSRSNGSGGPSGPSGSATGGTGGAASGSTGSGAPPVGSGTGGGSGSGAGSTGSSTGSRGPNRGDTRTQLDFTGFTYQGSGLAGLRRRFEELSRINVRDFPNAAHDLIRTVLECSIKDFFDVQGRQLQGRTTLGGSVDALAREFQTDQSMTTLINNINRSGRMPTSQYSGTADSLNATNHNPAAFASHTDVHEAWDRIKPILVKIVG